MHALITTVVDKLFEKGYGDDAVEATTVCLVQLKQAIADIDRLALEYRGKKITDKRRESVNEPLAQILFYSAALVHLSHTDAEPFDLEALTEFTETFPMEYQHDTLLCCNQMMGHATALMEMLFDYQDDEDEPEESPESSKSLDVEGAAETDSPFLVNLGDEEEPQMVAVGNVQELQETIASMLDGDNPENMLANIVAGVIILADKFDTDLDVILFNAGTIEEF